MGPPHPPGSAILSSSISDPGLIDVLPVKVGASYRILVINKVDSAVKLSLDAPWMWPGTVVIWVLDSRGYSQVYDPGRGKTVFGKRELIVSATRLSGRLMMSLPGYGVFLIEYVRHHPKPLPAKPGQQPMLPRLTTHMHGDPWIHVALGCGLGCPTAHTYVPATFRRRPGRRD